MTYVTIQDLKARMLRAYGAIYGAESPDAAATLDLEASEAEINGYLAGRYVVPVTAATALPLLKDWALTLAESRAYARATGQNDFSEKIKSRVEYVRDCLKSAANGEFPLAADLAEATSGSGVAIVDCDAPVFGRKRMRGF